MRLSDVASGPTTGWWCGLMLAWMTLSGVADEIEIRGHLTSAKGLPLADATVELKPHGGLWETAKAQLEGRAVPPVVKAQTGQDGNFKLKAPEAGPWAIVARHPRHLAMRCELKPLLDPIELPPVKMLAHRERRITTLDSTGRPLAGVRVAVRGWTPTTTRTAFDCWRPEQRSGTTNPQGQWAVASADDERLSVVALGADTFGFVQIERGAGNVSLRLTDRLIPARLVDDRDRPVAGQVVMTWDLALGVTGSTGNIRVPDPTPEGPLRLAVADPKGQLFIVKSETTAEQGLVLRLFPTLRVHGQVLDAMSRKPIVGAWTRFDETIQQAGLRGDYSLRLPAGGTPRFVAAAPGYLPQTLLVPRASSAAAGERPDLELTVALVRSLELAGRVVDADGEAIAGVEVTATLREQIPGSHSGLTIPRHVHQRTAPDGSFRLAGLPPEVAFALQARRDGFTTRRLTVPALAIDTQPSEIKIVLDDGLTAFGVVLDDSEQPVVGAVVELVESLDQDLLRRHGGPEPERTLSAPGGRFEVSNLARSLYTLRVGAAGFAPLTVPGIEIAPPAPSTAPIDLGTVLLERGVTLVGQVTDIGGQSLEGAQISASGSEPTGLEAARQTTTTAADGTFEIAGLARGEPLRVDVGLEGYQHASLSAVVPDPEQPLRLVLKPSVTLRGQVVDEDGNGVGGTRLMLGRDHGSSNGRNTTADGQFTFAYQAPGKVTLVIHSPSGIADPVELELKGGEPPAEVRLVLRPAATLRGRLTDPDGEAVFEASVHLEPRPGDQDRWAMGEDLSATTDADGRFVIAGLDTGRYPLRVQHDDFEPMTVAVELEAGVDRNLELAFDTRRDRINLKVSGRVVDRTGAGVDGATVRLIGGHPSHEIQTVSFDGGGFELEASKPGSWALRVGHPEYASQRTSPFELGQTAVTDQEIVLIPGGSVTGRVIGLDLEMLSRLVIEAMAPELGRRGGQVRHDGRYQISALAAGEWTISARLSDPQRMVSESVHLSGEGDLVEADLTFEPGYQLRGLALLDGAPWDRARASLACPEPHLRSKTEVHAGRFTFEGVTAGLCEITLTDLDQGAMTARQLLEITGDDEILIEVATGQVAGQVLDARGLTPIADATLQLRPAATAVGGQPAARSKTDAGGRFELPCESDRRWHLRVSATGYATAELAVEAGMGDIQILLGPAAPATLFVHDAKGEVPRSLVVIVKAPDGRIVEAMSYVRPDIDGRLNLTTLAPGLWNVTLFSDGHSVEFELQLPGEPVSVVLGE